MVSTVDELVTTLGGTAAVAALGGVGLSAVSNWKSRGRIPSEKFLIFAGALEKMSKTADPALFGFDTAAEVQP